ncbi:MAG: glycosyltransferase family 39 protein [Rhodospirillales bacterium]|nr:glycosyltransferase family 39 protein [Rhodospirillales bacterium]
MERLYEIVRGEGRTWWDRGAWLLLCALMVLVILTFHHYGISNDEEVQHRYGEMLLDFYSSGFADDSAFHFKDLYYYGGLFDMAAILLDRLLPLEIWDTRHLLSALIGVLGIAAVWRLGRLLAGPRVGFIAALLLALTGAWYGGMFNHTKDIPFATAMAWSLYFLCRVLAELPRPSPRTVIGFGLALGCALGIRVGAAVIVVPFAAGLTMWAIGCAGGTLKDRANQLVAIGARLLPAAALAYVVMAISWPWAVLDPLNPWRALDHFSQLEFPIRTILAGQVMWITEVPATYLPIYLVIKLPLLMLVGLLMATVYAGVRRWLPAQLRASSPEQRIGLMTCMLAGAFPIAWFIIEDLPAYDGIRHFLFVVPPLAVLAAFGLARGLDMLAMASLRLAVAGATAAFLVIVLQAHVLARLHPYEYVDYNALVGGLAGAQRKYVMDYWANTVPEATRALVAQLRLERPATAFLYPYKVWVCSERETFEAVAPPFLIWTRNPDEADFYIAPTHLNCDRPADWTPQRLKGRIIHTVERLGVSLAVVRDRRGVIASTKALPRS